MPRAPVLTLALALLAVGLAGCTTDDPEESTGPEESVEVPTGPTPEAPAEPAPATPDAAPAPQEPAPPAEPTPVAPPAAEPPAPAPTPVAPPAPPPASPAPPSPAPPGPAPPPPSPTPATPSPTQPSWPREGSTVRYEVVVLSGSPDGYYNMDWFTNWTWTYSGGDWTGVCEGTHVHGPYGEPQTREPMSETFTAATPPHWPPMNTRSPPAVGEVVTAWRLFRCEIESRQEIYRGMEDGLHHATDVESEVPYDFRTHWDPGTGLVLKWDQWGRYTHSWGHLTART